MDRYKAYLLPGAAAVLVLAYYMWRWTSGVDVTEPSAAPATPKAAVDSKAPGSSKTDAGPGPSKSSPEPPPSEPPKE